MVVGVVIYQRISILATVAEVPLSLASGRLDLTISGSPDINQIPGWRQQVPEVANRGRGIIFFAIDPHGL